MPQSTAIMHLRLLLLTSLAYLASSSPISSPLQSTPIDPATMDYFTDINAIRNSPAVLAAIKAYQDGGNEVSIATCSNYDIASAKMPTVPGLPGPSDGLSPYHIALGVGVQVSSSCTPIYSMRPLSNNHRHRTTHAQAPPQPRQPKAPWRPFITSRAQQQWTPNTIAN